MQFQTFLSMAHLPRHKGRYESFCFHTFLIHGAFTAPIVVDLKRSFKLMLIDKDGRYPAGMSWYAARMR